MLIPKPEPKKKSFVITTGSMPEISHSTGIASYLLAALSDAVLSKTVCDAIVYG
jgi:hypothetical protein